MELMQRYLPLWLALFVAIPAFADEAADKQSEPEARKVELHPMEATYGATLERGVSISGEATRSLEKREDGRWLYRFDVDSFIADIRESSVLRYEDQLVISDRYRYSLEGFFIRNRSTRYNFNWEDMLVRYLDKNRDIDISDEPGIQDQLAAQLQLWIDLQAGMQKMEYVILDDEGDFKDYQFEVLREETLETRNFGDVETVLVERIRDEDSPRTTLMWFAPEWDHLLVRLDQHNEEGENFEIYLKEATLHDREIQP
jgi:hypothetical protein